MPVAWPGSTKPRRRPAVVYGESLSLPCAESRKVPLLRLIDSHSARALVAQSGGGFEPSTFGLWAIQPATQGKASQPNPRKQPKSCPFASASIGTFWLQFLDTTRTPMLACGAFGIAANAHITDRSTGQRPCSILHKVPTLSRPSRAGPAPFSPSLGC